MMLISSEERRRHVMEAVLELASRLDLEVSPRILKDSNNTIVHLSPLPLVAKLGTSHFRDASIEALDRELDVARHLASKDAPIVCPSAETTAGPHRIADLIVTLWQFHEDRGAPEDEGALGPLLARVHKALLDYPGPLPPFTAELEDVGRILQDRTRLGRLPEEDLRFLRRTHQELELILSALRPETRPLHGSPHSGNFPRVNREVLGLLRRMRSLCVAVKCWIDPDRAPEVGEAAVVHLRLLRGQPLN